MWKVYRYISGSCLIADFGISGIKTSGYANIELVCYYRFNN
jgi:hypothetical protein